MNDLWIDWRRVARVLALLVVCGAGASQAGEVRLLSRADPAKAPDVPSGAANLLDLSADGRWIAFEDGAPNVVAGQSGPPGTNIFLQDRLNGAIVLVSRAAGSTTQGGNDSSGYPSISDDGRFVYFASQATDLVAGQVDTPNSYDVFVFDRVAGTTALVSHASGSPATAANGPSHVQNFETATAFLSADGRLAAYSSRATNLVAGQVDTNNARDVFLYDQTTGTSKLVSHVPGSAVTAGNGASSEPFVSADGRWVVFESLANNLVAGQEAGVNLYDDSTGTLSFVAPGSDPKISADGGWIVFVSGRSNLIPGQVDNNSLMDVFLAERATGALTLVSRSSESPTQTGNQPSGNDQIDTDEPVLSADGRYVAFVSEATDLVSGQMDANGSFGEYDVFLFDRTAGTVSLVSGAAGAPASQTGDRQSLGPTISSDGRYVAFFSRARNLVSGQADVNFGFDQDVFLYDRITGAKTLASHANGSAATTGSSGSYLNRLSGDGSRVAYISWARNLAAGVNDDNAALDVYAFDRAAGTNALVSRRGGPPEAAAGGEIEPRPSAALSHDGRWVAFVSSAADVDAGAEDTNNLTDVFLFDRLTSQISLVSRENGTGSAAGGFDPLVSADGRSVVFLSTSPGLVPGQVNASSGAHVFLYNRPTGAMTLVSHAAWSAVTTANQGSAASAVSASRDGRWIAFTSPATNLVAGQVEGNGAQEDVFLFDQAGGAIELVSRSLSSPLQTGNGASRDPSISADGRWVAFASAAADLVAGRAGGVFLWDRDAEALTWVGPGDQPEISDDGRWIAFLSSAAGVVPGQTDTNGGSDVFLWDRETGTTTLASHSTASATAAGNGVSTFTPQSESPDVLSADGRFLVFASRATDLAAGVTDTNGLSDVFVFDRNAGISTLVSHASSSPLAAANGESADPGVSADGSHVVFRSWATALVDGQVDSNTANDLFVYRLSTGTIDLVSRSTLSPSRTGSSATDGLPRISADGAFIAFSSYARDLADGDAQIDEDAFLFSSPPSGRDFFTLPPCRLLDTRLPGGGPAIASGETRTLTVNGVCGVPVTARAVTLNVTVVQPSGAGYLTLHPADAAAPVTSTLNFAAGETRANNAVLLLALDGSGTLGLSPFVAGSGSVHVIVDVAGYFE
jgi:Tol biopolymer transport system component